jgi:predicted small secreted protein
MVPCVMKRSIIVNSIVFVAMSTVVWACPNCKDGIANGPNASIGDAYSMSVVFMLTVPITILTVFTVVIARKLKQGQG